MNIRGYSWAGAPTSDFDGTTRFFGEDLGLTLLKRDDERKIAIFQLPTGQLFEIFGPGSGYQELMNAPALAFDVDDIGKARTELETKGVKFVTEVERGSEGDAWTYFEGPDGFLYEIWQRAGEPEGQEAV